MESTKNITYLKQKIAEFLLLELTTNKKMAGVSPDFQGALSAIPLGELRSYAETIANKYLSVEIDLPALEEGFSGERQRKRLLEELIKHGASIQFICRCLSASPDDIRRAELRLNITRNRFSRKVKTDEMSYFRMIYAESLESVSSNEAHPEAIALIDTAKKTGYLISRIEPVINLPEGF
jgi:hypothetical protein